MFFSIFWDFVAFILAVGVLISVHEFGHFWIARLCNVKVECFSIGFGKPLFNFYDKHGTKYIIAAIPLGGYVKMLNDKINEVPIELKHKAFNNKNIMQRILIISAGSISNFIFAFLACWIIFMHGMTGIKPIINKVIDNSIAFNNKITDGTEIKYIDGVKTPDWNSVRIALMNKIGHKNVIFTIIPFGKINYENKNIDLSNLKIKQSNDDILLNLGIRPYGPYIDTTLSAVKYNSPASKAGLKIGDKIIKVNDKTLTDWEQFLHTVKNNIGKKIYIEIKRNNEFKNFVLIPKLEEKIINQELLGMKATIIPLSNKYKIFKKYGPFEAIEVAVNKVWQLIKMNASMLINIFTGEIHLKNLSGPVSIAKLAGSSAEHGLYYYLMFLVLISVNLGVINLFPLPILDGGQLMFLIIEKIKGSPISDNIQNISYRISLILLIILMGFVIFNDFSRLK